MATAAITVLGQVALQALKLCNKCCKNKEKEDDDKNKDDDQKAGDDDKQEDDDDVSENEKNAKESESESETEEKKESAPMNKKKRRAKKKRSNEYSVPAVEPVTTQPFTIQTTINPVFYNNFQPHPSSIPPGLPQWVLPNGTDSATTDQSFVKWEYTSIENAVKLLDTVVVGGYDIDETDLWIIRARFKCEVIPGKLNQFHKLAFIAYKTAEGYIERNIDMFEVLCIAPESRGRIRWTKCSNGVAPKNAVEAGRKASGEKLYIGRTIQEDEKYPGRHSLCPGMVQPSHGVLYVTYGLKVYAHKFYEVLCID